MKKPRRFSDVDTSEVSEESECLADFRQGFLVGMVLGALAMSGLIALVI